MKTKNSSTQLNQLLSVLYAKICLWFLAIALNANQSFAHCANPISDNAEQVRVRTMIITEGVSHILKNIQDLTNNQRKINANMKIYNKNVHKYSLLFTPKLRFIAKTKMRIVK